MLITDHKLRSTFTLIAMALWSSVAMAECLLTQTITSQAEFEAAVADVNSLECEAQTVTWNIESGLSLLVVDSQKISSLAERLVLNGDSTSRPVFEVNVDDFFISSNSGVVEINNLIFDGDSGESGSALNMQEGSSLTMTNSEFKNFKQRALVSYGSSLTIRDSSFSANSSDQSYGGAVFAEYSNVQITASTFTDNQVSNNTIAFGGAIATDYSEVVIEDSLFEDNRALSESIEALTNGGGAALFYHTVNAVVIQNSVFRGNRSSTGLNLSDSYEDHSPSYGGAIFSAGSSIEITGSTFESNSAISTYTSWGGALQVTYGYAVIEQSLFWENQATRTSAVNLFSTEAHTMQIQNSTFHANHAARNGSTVETHGGFQMSHSTITSNTVSEVSDNAAVLRIFDKGTQLGVDISHSILADNDFGNAQVLYSCDSGNCGGVQFSYSLLDDQTHTLTDSFEPYVIDGTTIAGGDGLAVVDPMLNRLADNGGPTQTRYPQEGSPVINAGNPNIADAPEYDQRDFTRVIETIDIGSVEYDEVHTQSEESTEAPVKRLFEEFGEFIEVEEFDNSVGIEPIEELLEPREPEEESTEPSVIPEALSEASVGSMNGLFGLVVVMLLLGRRRLNNRS